MAPGLSEVHWLVVDNACSAELWRGVGGREHLQAVQGCWIVVHEMSCSNCHPSMACRWTEKPS